MNYIIGKKFIVNTVVTSGSIQERLALRQHTPRSSTPNDLFKTGAQYTVYYIKPIKENNSMYYDCFFKQDEVENIVNVRFNNTAEADDYIARLSGETNTLKKMRDDATKALTAE